MADQIILVVVLVLRLGILVLGATETVGSTAFRPVWVVTVVLVVLTAQSAITLIVAGSQLRRSATPVLGDRYAILELLAAAGALFAVASVTKVQARTTFWVEQYAVISCVVIAAAARRMAVGAIAAACLTVAYLLAVFGWVNGGAHLSKAQAATAWTNAVSFLQFFAIAAIGFHMVRAIVGQSEVLRRTLSRLSAERARIGAAGGAYRIGHDIPKALLREVRRGLMSAEQLRPWAAQYRDDLQAAISGHLGSEVDLRAELTALSSAFAAAMTLHVDLDALGTELPPGTPTLLLVESARELLNNASYHAYGYPASLMARSTPAQLQLTIHNDGPPVNPAVLRSAWTTKQNTLYQFEVAGGAYCLTPGGGPSSGTTVTLTWPASPLDTRGKTAPMRP
jgi:hypothetical protein